MLKPLTFIFTGICVVAVSLSPFQAHSSLVSKPYGDAQQYVSYYLTGMSHNYISVEENSSIELPVELAGDSARYSIKSSDNVVTAAVSAGQLALTIGEVDDDTVVNLSVADANMPGQLLELAINVVNKPTLAIDNFAHLSAEQLLTLETPTTYRRFGVPARVSSTGNGQFAYYGGQLRGYGEAVSFNPAMFGRVGLSSSDSTGFSSGYRGSVQGQLLTSNSNANSGFQPMAFINPAELSELPQGMKLPRLPLPKYRIDVEPRTNKPTVRLARLESPQQRIVEEQITQFSASQQPSLEPSASPQEEQQGQQDEEQEQPPSDPKVSQLVEPIVELPEEEREQPAAQGQQAVGTTPTVVEVPEPAAFYLFAVALAGLMLVNRSPHSRHL